MVILLAACTQWVNLQTQLHDTDANEIVALLNRYGIEAKKQATKEGVAVVVKDSDIARSTEIMKMAGLPKRSLSNLGDVFKKEGMISTPLEERVRYIHGLSQELEYTLQNFDNVISARVHVVLPERIAPGEPVQPSSAAVYVKYREPFDVDSNGPRIRSLVAASIPGLANSEDKSKVSVIFSLGGMAPKQLSWERVGPFNVEAESASTLRNVLLTLLALSTIGCISVFMLIVLKIRGRKGVPQPQTDGVQDVA